MLALLGCGRRRLGPALVRHRGTQPSDISPHIFGPSLVPVHPKSVRLDEVSRRIFGNMPNLNIRTGAKVLSKKPKGPLLVDYYHNISYQDVDSIGRDIFEGYLSEKEEARKMQLAILKRRGKSPPKKGFGKRAQKAAGKAKAPAAKGAAPAAKAAPTKK
ncbi:hypothetical protein M885DRAFT_552056 [Pelagophyceae sp. CCMP2097]|nr:hypothetical protein M885DRAFT_552056 [Pelagophyceae sp. CCMP2097]